MAARIVTTEGALLAVLSSVKVRIARIRNLSCKYFMPGVGDIMALIFLEEE
jgi:hypothetical protein